MKTHVLPTNTSIFDHIARRPFAYPLLIGRRFLQADNLSKDDTLVKTACLPPMRSTSIEHVVHSNLSLFPKSALLFQILCEFEFCWSVLVHVHAINIINEYERFWKHDFFLKNYRHHTHCANSQHVRFLTFLCGNSRLAVRVCVCWCDRRYGQSFEAFKWI